MAIIKKEVNIKGSSIDLNQYTNMDYNIALTPSVFEIKITGTDIEGKNTIILWHELPLDVMKSHNGFTDNSLWCMPTIASMFNPDADASTILTKYDMIDMFAKTSVSKASPLSATDENPLYQIFVPAYSGTFNDFTIILSVLPEKALNAGYTISGPSKDLFNDIEIPLQSLITPITLSSSQTNVSVDSSIKINVTTSPNVSEVYIEPVYGACNKTRVKIVNGSGSFSISTLELNSGDEIRAKAGFRKFSGVASFSMIVS